MIPTRFAPLLATVAAVALAACRPDPASGGPSGAPSTVAASATADTPPRPPSAAELAILAPAAAGGSLDGFAIRDVRVTGRGLIELVCEKGPARVTLTVALLVDGGPAPPASTERYAIFYSLREAPPEDGERLSKALATLLQANRATPPPPGLGPFVPRPLSL